MTPVRDGKDVWFSVTEAADVLEVGRQAVYAAIRSGRIEADVRSQNTRIHIEHLINYGVKTGRDPNVMLKQLQQQTEVNWKELAFFFLAAFGLAWLITQLSNKE